MPFVAVVVLSVVQPPGANACDTELLSPQTEASMNDAAEGAPSARFRDVAAAA